MSQLLVLILPDLSEALNTFDDAFSTLKHFLSLGIWDTTAADTPLPLWPPFLSLLYHFWADNSKMYRSGLDFFDLDLILIDLDHNIIKWLKAKD